MQITSCNRAVYSILRKSPLIVFIIALLALVTGCSQSGESTGDQPTLLKLATDSGARGSPAGNAMDRWAELIETGTDGQIEVRVFYQNELGGQQDLFDLYIANDVNLTLNWPVTSYDSRIALIYTPYMFTAWDEALEAYRPGGWVHGLLSSIYADLGLKFFGAWPEGFNGMATRGNYATSVEQASDSKLTLRAPPIFPFPETVQAMGYQTATIDWGEVYPAIQTGVVDGDATNVIYWDYEFFRDVIDYYTHTRQQFNTGILSINLETWDALTPAQQKVVEDAAFVVMEEGFAGARERDRFYVEKAREAGIEYIELTEEELEAMATVVRERIWPMMEERIGREIMDAIRANTGM